MSTTTNREELLHNAVLFLLDPKVKAESTLTSRITFLEGKGLTEPEIQEALRRADNGGQSSSRAGPSTRAFASPYAQNGGQVRFEQPPAFPRRDWRDIFIMAVISGGVVYGLAAIAKKYLMPHLKPPTTSTFQQTSQSLEEQYDAAQTLLNQLTESTQTLQTNLENDREKINKVVEDVQDAVRSVKDNEERWREEMREVRGEVESIRDLVPKMIEKHAANQSSSLAEMQNELRSLKSLLQSRTAPAPTPTSNPTRTQSPQPGNNGSLASSTGSLPGSASSPSLSGGISSTTAAANALLTPKSRGIPAWQKAPSNTTATAAGSSTSASAAGSGEDSSVKGKGKEIEEIDGSS